MRAPISVSRAVTTPSKGAVILLNSSSAFSRSTSPWSAATSAVAALSARHGAVVVGLLTLLFLHRDDALGQIPPTFVGGLGELLFGFPHLDRRARRIELGFRRGQLRVEIRGVDLGQQIALLHVGAVIEIPVLQIAVDPRVDRRLVPGLDGAGQHQALGRGALPRRDDGDGRNCLLLRPLRDFGLMAAALQNPERRDDDRCGGGDDPDPAQVSRRTRRWGGAASAAGACDLPWPWVLRSGGWFGLRRFRRGIRPPVVPGMQYAENDRHEEQRRDGRNQ